MVMEATKLDMADDPLSYPQNQVNEREMNNGKLQLVNKEGILNS